MDKATVSLLALLSAFSVSAATDAQANERIVKGVVSARQAEAAKDGLQTGKVNFADIVGPVKPLHGIGSPPIGGRGRTELFHYLREAGIPFSRLHDVGGWLGAGMYVDIPNLFPNFDADENDPKSYRFWHTDVLMKGLAEHNVEPIFRLGVTIENWVGSGLPAERTYPPKDYKKWARICEHVIRHYTEGWNKGFTFKARYWELWNEPETSNPQKGGDMMWSASFEEFTRFYGVVMPYLKSKFPHLKMGGYGAIGFYAGVCRDGEPPEWPDKKHWVNFAHHFMREAKKGGWPLDFYSFHSYADPKGLCRQIRYADEMLNDYGFTRDKTERIMDEWIPYHDREDLDTAKQAAGIASAILGMQHGPCDISCIYDGRVGISTYATLFNPATLKPRKAYWSLYAFNQLYRLGRQVRTPATPAYVNAVAATDGKELVKIMIANDSKKDWAFDWELGEYQIDSALVIDGETNLGLRPFSGTVRPSEVWLLTLAKRPAYSRGVLCLTFDDRDYDGWKKAIPLFAKYDAHASFFVFGQLGGSELKVLKDLRAAGHTVGLHTVSHADAPAFFEKKGADAYLKEQLEPQLKACASAGFTPRFMAYPNNRHTPETDAFLSKTFTRFRAGAALGWKTNGYYVASRTKSIADYDQAFFAVADLPKHRVMDGVGVGEYYYADIDDICRAIRRAAERNEVFTIFSHDIRPDAKNVSMKTAWLERILKEAKLCGVAVKSFDELGPVLP